MRTALALAALLAAPAAGSAQGVENGTERAILEGLWRTQEEIVPRARRDSATERSPEAVAAAVHRRLRAIRREAGRLDGATASELERKAAVVADTLEAASVREGQLPSPRPLASRSATFVVPSSSCDRAPATAPGTVEWFEGTWTPDPRRVHFDREAWLRFDAPTTGHFVAHTGGSHADTEIAVFERCGAHPVAENDDAVGLQSATGIDALAGRSYWLRVRTLVGHPTHPVRLTVGGSGSIRGVVTAEATGEPLDGIRVRAYDLGGASAGSATSTADGSYSIEGLAPGTYFVRTSFSSPYLDELWNDRLCSPDCDVTTGDPVVVALEPVPGIDFALRLGGAISGRLREASTGLAIAFHYVGAFSDTGEFLEESESDEAGRYRIQGLATGSYRVATGDSGIYRDELYDDLPCEPSCDPTLGTPVEVVVAETTPAIDFALESAGTIAGEITYAANGEQVPFADLQVNDAAGAYVDSAQTDEQGRYELGGLGTGDYYVITTDYRFRNEAWDDVHCPTPDCDPLSGDPIPVMVGQVVTGIDFAIDRLGGIAGSVTESGSGAPLEGDVKIFQGPGPQVEERQIDPLGRFVVPYLFPGSYTAVTAVETPHLDELWDDLPCPGGGLDGCDPTTGTPISVALESYTEGVDFSLDRGGAIAGSVADAWTGESLDGAVLVWSGAGALVGAASAESDGSYLVEPLPGGAFFLTAEAPWHLRELYDELPCEPDCDPTTGTPVSVTLGATTTRIDFLLGRRGGIEGTVVQAGSGQPIVGAAVDAWTEAGDLIGTGASGSDGRYQIPLSGSGTRYVTTDNGVGLQDEIWENRSCPAGPAILGLCDPLSGDAVNVDSQGPATSGIDFALEEPLFADGFESGGTGAWSIVVP